MDITSKNIYSILQIVSIILAGLWSVYIFFRFEETKYQLTIEILNSQRIQADYEKLKSKLQIERSEIEIKEIKSQQVKISQDIKVRKIGQSDTNQTSQYYVEYLYSYENIGASKNEITYVIIDGFLYSLPLLEDTNSVELEMAADKKKCTVKKGFYYAPKWNNEMKDGKVFLKKGGGGTAELNPGEISEGEVRLLVRANPSDIIEFNMEVGINEGKLPENRWYIKKSSFLDLQN